MPERAAISRLPSRPPAARKELQPRWYAVAVHARQERAAATALSDRGFEVFLPARRERRMWSDRVQPIEQALFPGYLFICASMTAACRVKLLRPRQVYDLVGRTPGDPQIARPIAPAEIESLKTLIACERELTPADRLARGAQVLVCEGPLRGARGVLLSDPCGHKKLEVQLPLLGRAVRTWLTADDLLEAPAPAT